MNLFKLEISSPCSENFNDFKPTKKGGFCDSCQKEVIDFTRMNSEEIATYFKTRTIDNTCGRFTPAQLEAPMNLTKKNKFLSFISGI